MLLNAKIADHHLTRHACIYIRQSTMAQVRFNQESTERQYNLADQAKSLGWSPEQIRILDGDLAQSGQQTTKRDDFKTLVTDVAMGQVGAIFSLESSRLARSNKDWHRLLELCAITKTLVFDGDGCYDPSDFNDSLVLGMKGTFAQAELHIIRARLHGGKLNKAHKGELRFPLPVGLVFDGDKIVLDPDQEVQGAVRAAFELFEQENSAYGVVQRFHQLGLLFPRRSYGGVWNGKLIWGRLTHSRVLGVLTNPSYAGTYVFGRYQSCKKIGPAGEISTQSRQMPQDQWRVVIPDHHPGYITWAQFLANRSHLAANRTNSEVLAGPAREGLCLLQGVLLCGICGRRLSTRYAGNGGLYPSYDCNSRSRDASPLRHCMSLPAKPLDDAIAARLLTAVTPLTIKLALEALNNLEVRDKTISAQWRRRIERARYEADLAERRYEESDPSNRLVAATLEKRWNDAMQRVIELEAELAHFERQSMRSVTAEQKQQILRLGRDFPRLWKAPTTSARDRKRILRLLIRDITVSKAPQPKLLRLQICWQGGATETTEVQQRPSYPDVLRYPDAFVAKIRTMAERYDDTEIVARLKAEGLTSSTGKLFTASMISWTRYKHRISRPLLPDGTLNVRQVRARYGVSLWVVHYWIERGIVSATQRKSNAPYAIKIDDNVDQRLREWVANSSHLHPASPT
ncbi:recombinase family protein [Bradyrhizobium sp. CCGUVB23]|uniref:recombinase family protein n=1 Tax=Bradyrhizobium sp. CCGUVB23 TaxID=2949630 RepID=UPI0020B21A47|nr:recombinase family protein [Bradyrhizobium sp. CCGUVB23]MCP3468332.1 recombinase family protein [Bradyrhizobium sp. CCGUVB23]